jgi:cold shock CspA family protein
MMVLKTPCASSNRILWRSSMYGEIKTFHARIGVGVIAAEDGRRYRFHVQALLNRQDGIEGREVHFTPRNSCAQDIIVLAGSPWHAFGSLSLS